MAIKRLTTNSDNFSDDNLGNTIFGDLGNDIIRGNGGDDIIDGGLGSDTMYGGLGNDIMFVNVATDQTIEYAGQGVDRVIASIDWTLGANIENLTLTGSATVGNGNSLSNSIVGTVFSNVLRGAGGGDILDSGGGNDILDGGTGGDRMTGGTGNDYYYVDDAGDLVVERAAQGTDTVYSSNLFLFALPEYVEYVRLLGSSYGASGNNLSNIMWGNDFSNGFSGLDGNDIFYGYGGDDFFLGGRGTDKYFGGNGLDTVSYASAEATSGVELYMYALASNKGDAAGETFDSIEGFVGTRFDDILALDYRSSTGGTLDGGDGNDTLNGSAGNDIIRGGAGNDKINGGDSDNPIYSGGVDKLYGGSGGDTFFFTGNTLAFNSTDGSGFDWIYDFNAAEGDKLYLQALSPYYDWQLTTDSNGDINFIISNGLTIEAQVILLGVKSIAPSDYVIV